jgi:hypothetical protein
MESLYSKQRNEGKIPLHESNLFNGIHEQSFRGMGADTLTFYESTPFVSRAFPISLVRIPTTHMERVIHNKEMRETVDLMSRLFLVEFMNTVLEEWGQIH